MSYNPSYFTSSDKPYGVQGIPDGARMYFFNPISSELRPFESIDEILTYFNTPLNRKGHFTAVLNRNGVHTEWWWADGVLDEDLVLKKSASEIAETYGQIEFGGQRLELDWYTGIVPGESITWFDKHGPLKNVLIQTSRPDPVDAGFYLATLDWKKNLTNAKVIIENDGNALDYLFFSNRKSPTPGFWDDNEIWNDTYDWQD